MHDPNRLGQMILKHWQTHHPKMLAVATAAQALCTLVLIWTLVCTFASLGEGSRRRNGATVVESP